MDDKTEIKEENQSANNALEEGFWDRETPAPASAPAAVAVRPQKPNRSRSIIIAVGSILLAVAVFFIGWFSRYYALSEEERNILWILNRVENDYYHKLSDAEREAYYKQVYDGLMPDRFCSFFDKEEFATLMKEAEGSNSDTGLSALMDGDIPKVYFVQGNSSADLAGLTSGMTIFSYGKDAGSLTEATSVQEIGLFVQSNRGSFCLECGYSEAEKKVYTLESKEYLASYCTYSDSEVTCSFRGQTKLSLETTGGGLAGLDSQTAYIRYQGFDGNSAWEFEQCLAKMKNRNRSNLVIDLRCNGGGYLDLFRQISSHLLKDAEGSAPLVAYSVDRDGKKANYFATGNDYDSYFNADSRITVLADEYSASASECLIGALYDYGTIGYGDIYLRKDAQTGVARSYGKGVMQTTYVTSNGAAMRITSAEIFWPNGNSIHDKGVTEEDGAHGIVAPFFRGAEDVFLTQVFADLANK